MTITAPSPSSSPVAEACGCGDFRVSRRRLLGTAAATTGAVAGAQLFGDAFRQVAYGAETGANVVVVLSMRGGADGLSMVVPSTTADQTVLQRLRPDIYVPSASLLPGDRRFGLHPAFAPLADMWGTTKNFAAVHAVGLPAPNRSHFEAMNEVEDADPGHALRTGWINRTVGLSTAGRPEDAMQLGSVLGPASLRGPAPALSTGRVADLQVAPFDPARAAGRRSSVAQLWADDTTAAGGSVRAALGATDRLSTVVNGAAKNASDAANPVHLSAYPAGSLQTVLADTSALVRADVGVRFVTVDYGNWDMHQGLGKSDAGWMHDQVDHLATSLKAFFADLGSAASRVTVVTMSEFGRRVAQNGSGGVDHGYGNAMLLLGAGVKGGTVYGGWRGLDQLTDGDVSVETNFQSVLWEVLRSRFPDLSGSRGSIFPQAEQKTLGAMV